MGDPDEEGSGSTVEDSGSTAYTPVSSSKSSRRKKKSKERGALDENAENNLAENGAVENGVANPKKKKKKKSKKSRGMVADASDTDASDQEGGYKYKPKRRGKGDGAGGGGGDGDDEPPNADGGTMQAEMTSMLDSIKSKRRARAVGDGETRPPSSRGLGRDVSFSGSVIKRDDDRAQSGKGSSAARYKEQEREKAGVALPSGGSSSAPPRPPPPAPAPTAAGGDDDGGGGSGGNDALLRAMGKMPSSMKGSFSREGSPPKAGGALRPSKYGKKTSFASDEPEWKVSDDDNRQNHRPKFRSGPFHDDDDDDDDDNDREHRGSFNPAPFNPARVGPRVGPRRTSFENPDPFEQALTGSLTRDGHQRRATDPNDRRNNFANVMQRSKDSLMDHKDGAPRGNGSRTRRRTQSDGDASAGGSDHDGARGGGGARGRAGIQRRNTMSFTSQRRASFNLSEDGSDEGKPRRTTLTTSAAQSMYKFSGLQTKESRRLKMSSEHQTYIPPKSRNTSVFQALMHVLAGRLVDLTLWTYGASFLKVLMFFLGLYISCIFVFAAFLDGVDQASGGNCVHYEEMNTKDRYEYMFELAWATFTTVGYGTIGPKGDQNGCYAIRFSCAFVAFVGVIFASTTAAIMYSKLMRLLACAHVTFSSTLCVQYGKGNESSTIRFGQLNFRASVAPAALKQLSSADLLEDSDDEDGGGNTEDGFPVIEFRMINDRANHEGSEIWDAQIRGIVQLLKEQPNEDKPPGASNSFAVKDKATGGEGSNTLDLEKKVYYPISLSPDMHPHFSRIWYARHVLNAESPLLKREIRDEIVRDGGKWDKDYNNWEEIRDCLNKFISLRITLSGTSAVSASDVYCEHVYEFDDVCVGWRFANMAYEKKDRMYKSWWRRFGFGRSREEDERHQVDAADTRTKIDAALLHDIVPQPGGDFEPLDANDKAGKWW